MSPTILIVHRDLVCAEGLAAALAGGGLPPAEIVTSPVEAAARLARPGPDILLIDWNMPPTDALGLINVWVRERPGLRVIAFGVDHPEKAVQCVASGCRAALLRHEGVDDLRARIVEAAPPRTTAPPHDGPDFFLTRRQEEIADLIEQGLSNKEIARALGLAVHTVKNHIHILITKLAIETRYEVAEAIRFRRRHGPQTPAETHRVASARPPDFRAG